MKVILFGATGMVGQGVLRECLRDPEVEQVLAVGRSPVPQRHARLRQLTPPDLFDLADVERELGGHDACFFCLGVSSAGLGESAYRRLTFDLTLSVARVLARIAPGMTFVYVSGQGTDATGRGRAMWARVKGETENALLRLPLKAVMFRPGFIQPLHGITSRTALYRAAYAVLSPIFPVLNALAPDSVTTTERLGRAMLAVARRGAPRPVLETRDINQLGGGPGGAVPPARSR
jgi:uncharacterized protein YbjT (DUF2867 family)